MNNIRTEEIKNDFEPIRKLLIEFREKNNNQVDLIQYVTACISNKQNEIETHKQIHIVLKNDNGEIGMGERIILEA